MLPDQTHLASEVEGDCKKVLSAYADALANISPEAATGIAGMKPRIDDWCKRGRDAAATRDKTPGPNGWPGWVKAGTIYLDGIEEIYKEGKAVKLDAITAQALNVPKTTVDATVKAVAKVQKKVEQAAHDAVHAVGDLGSGIGKVATRVGLAACAVLVLLVVVRN